MLLIGAGAALAAEDEEEPPEDVVVEGERQERSDPAEAGESVTVVPLDARLPPGSDVADVVARAPGTTVRRLGGLGSYAAVSLRGSALRQVQVHLDGLPLNPDGSAAVNLAAVPLAALDHVAVWRGAAPPELAAAPLGGVVDLRTRDADAPLTLRVEGGSWRTARALVHGAASTDQVRVLGGASVLTSRADFRAFDDNNTPGLLDDDRVRRRTDNDRTQAAGLLSVASTRPGGWRGLGAVSLRDEGLAGPIGGLPLGRLRTAWALAAVGRDLGVSSSMRGWAQAREELRTPPDGGAKRDRFAQAGLTAHTAHVTERLRLGVTGQARLDLQHQQDTPGRPRRATLTAVPALRWLPTRGTAIEPVLHVQGWLEGGFGEEAARLAFNPRISVRARPTEHWVVHAAAGRAVRPPDFLELFGDRGATVGRADLRPERSVWADVGARYLRSAWSAEVAAFASDAVDRILFVQNGARALVPINAEPSSVVGVEGGLTGGTRHLDARLSATWTETWMRAGPHAGRRLPRIPRLAGHLDLGARPVHQVRLGLTADALGGNAWDQANLTIAPPRLLVGADLRVDPGGPWPAVDVGVRNLADRIVARTPQDPRYPDGPRVERPLTDFAGYPLPGRTWVVGLTWSPRRPTEPPR